LESAQSLEDGGGRLNAPFVEMRHKVNWSAHAAI
jgi:hypothetical protein